MIRQCVYYVNVMNIFDNTTRRKQGHDHRQYTSPKLHDVSIYGLLSVRSKTTRNASHSNKTVFLTTFKGTLSICNLPKSLNY